MNAQSWLPLFFLVLAAIFGLLTVREHWRGRPSLSPAGRTWRRTAIVFGTIGIFLFWYYRSRI